MPISCLSSHSYRRPSGLSADEERRVAMMQVISFLVSGLYSCSWMLVSGLTDALHHVFRIFVLFVLPICCNRGVDKPLLHPAVMVGHAG
jgi:hypothetical protein